MAGYIKFDGVDGECSGARDHQTWINIDSLQWGVGRRLGDDPDGPSVVDSAFVQNDDGDRFIFLGLDVDGDGKADGVLAVEDGSAEYELVEAYVKSWSTSGAGDTQATEEVSFYYNKIAFSYASVNTDKDSAHSEAFDWTV